MSSRTLYDFDWYIANYKSVMTFLDSLFALCQASVLPNHYLDFLATIDILDRLKIHIFLYNINKYLTIISMHFFKLLDNCLSRIWLLKTKTCVCCRSLLVPVPHTRIEICMEGSELILIEWFCRAWWNYLLTHSLTQKQNVTKKKHTHVDKKGNKRQNKRQTNQYNTNNN